ncbi:MAG: 2-amino-4-hydroxy-6-hydroxymethyldihydropteridine diphosphokinase [Lachnospiraceae bacterium]|jgi:dihydroneopterin aldolase/2-amino-4-hydroxy-6-hydroxymethyldihydropteridine diphosphokinase|nr:2-amino-4-hydroxy-6-hydroxymethyldihydropteridine diphosphokinase [Lachnospiraceae bacterium]
MENHEIEQVDIDKLSSSRDKDRQNTMITSDTFAADEIIIKRLKCFAYHGVYEEENIEGQVFYVSVILYTDTRPAAMSDDIKMATDYGEVADFIQKMMTTETCKLLETVAAKIASGLLLTYPLITKVDIEIEKPDAPLKHEFETVAVKISRTWHKVYIGLGANLGNCKETIHAAIADIRKHPQIRDVRLSSLVTSAPYGNTDQGNFTNAAAEFYTLLTPLALLAFLQEIEAAHGRIRFSENDEKNVRWGERTLDLDILLYDSLVIQAERLILPHPDMASRDFVLAPLAELAPALIHPVYDTTITKLLRNLTKRHIFSN